MTEESYNHDRNSVYEKLQASIGDRFVAFRPRILYCSLFVWNTVTCGKFIAPLLQHLSPKFSDSLVGETLAMQYLIVACLAGWGGSLADTTEKRFSQWGQGRLLVLAGSVMLGTIAFMGHALPELVAGHWEILRTKSEPDYANWDFVLVWHILMRCIYAVGMAICAPAIDGLALAHLDIMEGATQADFGKERMYGALFWGLGSLVNGVGIDCFGFDFLYFMVIFSTVTTYLVIGVYMWGLDRDSTGAFARKIGAIETNSCPMSSQNNKEQTAFLPPQNATNSDNIPTKSLLLMLCKTGYGVALMFFLFVLASGISVVDNLAFMFFSFLGSSDTMNGFTVVFTVFMEVPCFYLAPELLKRHGPGRMLLYAGLAYVIRVTGYTVVPKGHMWMVLILELFHGITYACQKVGSVEYVAQIMPKGLEASGQGILLLVNYFGVVVGLVVAGWMQEKLGPRVMYGFMGLVVFLGVIVLVVAEKCSSDVAEPNVMVNHLKGERTHLIQK